MKALSKSFLPPAMAWILIFVPAFLYYVSTRLYSWGLFRSSTVGDAIEFSIGSHCSFLSQQVLSTAVDCTSTLQKGIMYRILQEPQMVATTWKHDEELGRGYLLLSTSLQKGKVWQWETGGGPISIGKTLHLQDSGCRSQPECHWGSGGLIVETWHEPPRLIISEWGEGRIVRLEPTTGARTPLIIRNYDQTDTPLRQPRQLLLTAFGDLIILDHSVQLNESSRLWQLPQVPKIPPLLSLAESRQAHAWTSTNYTANLILEQSRIGGVALVPKEWLKLYVTMTITSKVVLATLSQGDDEEEPRQSQILLDYSDYASQPGPVIVDNKGRLYLAVDQGILVVEPSNTVVGHLTMSNITDPIVSMTLGEDRFLYVATAGALYRMKMRTGPMEFPTNLVVKVSGS